MARKYYDEHGNEVKRRGGCLKWIGIIFILLVAVGVGGYFLTDNNSTEISNPISQLTQGDKEEASKEPEIEVTATEIMTTFNDNELKGKELYTGKLAKITGTVGEIGESLGQTYITLKDDSNPYSILSLQCYFKEENQEGLSNLSAGDTVTLIGTIGEKSLNVAVKDCKLVD